MFVAGLTGGIATGKSAVSSIMRQAGAVIIDADKIAFDAVQKGMPAWHDIVRVFGGGVLADDGQIDRVGLGDIIFNDSRLKDKLDDIVHPVVKAEMDRRIEEVREAMPSAVVILDVPLLIETGMQESLSEVILVYAPVHIQTARLMARDGISRQDAGARISSQMPIDEKKRYATIVIDNSLSLDLTSSRAIEVYRHLSGLAV